MGRLAPGVCIVLACCWCGGVRAARADQATPVVFFHAADRRGGEGRAAYAVLEEVALRSGTVVVDLSPPGQAESQAGEHLRRGIEAYRRFEYEASLGHLEKGVAEASATGALGLTHSELSDLLIYRALAVGQLGDSARSWDDFVRAATVDPTRKLDPVRFAPRVVESFDRAVQAVVGQATVAVEIALAQGCEAFLDGRVVATGTSTTVPEGEHYVRASCEGKHPYGARVVLRGERETLRPELQDLRAPTTAEVVTEAARRGAAELVWCVLARTRRGGATLAMRRIDVASGKETAGVVLRLGGGEDDRAAIAGAASRMLERPQPAGPPLPSRPTPWYRRPWLWAAAGVVVTSAVLLPFTLDKSNPTGFDVRIEYPR